jgi:hypothetical protein
MRVITLLRIGHKRYRLTAQGLCLLRSAECDQAMAVSDSWVQAARCRPALSRTKPARSPEYQTANTNVSLSRNRQE